MSGVSNYDHCCHVLYASWFTSYTGDDGLHPKIYTFYMHALIWVHHKVVSQFYQPFFQNDSHWNRQWHNPVFELCCGPNSKNQFTVV